MLLVAPPKPDGSLGEGSDEACIPVFQASEFGSGLTTGNCKKKSCYGASNENMNYNDVRWPSRVFRGSSESRREATDRKMAVPSGKTKTRIGFFVPCLRLVARSLKSSQKCNDTSYTFWG